jgi:hypothetical protein
LNKDWWLSSAKMTVRVTVDRSARVIAGPPIVKRFVGQPLVRLMGWMMRQGEFEGRELNEGGD